MIFRGIISLGNVLSGLVGVLVHGLTDLEGRAVLVQVAVDYMIVLAHRLMDVFIVRKYIFNVNLLLSIN